MSTTIDITTVTDAISHLSIAGVTIKDIDEIPDSAGLNRAIMFPRPDNPVTNFRVEYAEETRQLQNVYYTLNYMYLHLAASGGMGGIFAFMSGLMTNVVAIVTALTSATTLGGATLNGNPLIGQISPVTDPAGNTYQGCSISIDIMQFLEV
jgi:hypothetical protein